LFRLNFALSLIAVLSLIAELCAHAALPTNKLGKKALLQPKHQKIITRTTKAKPNSKSKAARLAKKNLNRGFSPIAPRPHYDLPITHNSKVRFWMKHYQKGGRFWFKRWMERSYRYMPQMQAHMRQKGIPQDLAYVAMIESGFLAHATSTAAAVGYWQFIRPTANRYGLRTSWWLDERRDFTKSTRAAASYLSDLYKIFQSWYLTAAAYNMGEGRLHRLIKRHKTNNFWVLSKKRDFPKETREYIPKLIAALLISKRPRMYGFYNIQRKQPFSYEYFSVPGGTDLYHLSKYLKVNKRLLKRLNPELIHGFIPGFINSHRIRVPKGTTTRVSQFVRSYMKK